MATGDNTPLGDVSLGDFKSAITDAVKSGMAGAGTSTSGGVNTSGFQGSGDSVPSDPATSDSPEQIETKITNMLKSAGVNIDKFAGKTGKTVAEMSKELYDYQKARAKANKEELKYIYQAREQIGGISIIPDDQGRIATGLAQQVIEQYEEIYKRGTDAYESNVKFQGALADFQVSDLYKDATEFGEAYTQMFNKFATDMPNMAKNLSDDMAETLLGFKKALSISDQDMSDILKRQYAFTGEATDEIFGQIANVSKSLADTTGLGANKLKKEIVAIITDVDRFGNIGVDSAGRISAALNQLGVDYNTFVRLTDQFMNFDSAATKMGDLSALFGIQMDAMEMTYLANEDQEEFLFRMREEILDAGIDVENMSNARARALAGQLNMNVSQMKMFLREGEMAVDQAEMAAATDASESMHGLTTAAQNFGDVFESSSKSVETALKEVITPMIMESKSGLLEAHKAAAVLSKEMRKFEFDEEATKAIQDSIQAATETRVDAINLQTKATITSMNTLNAAASEGVKLTEGLVQKSAELGSAGIDLVTPKVGVEVDGAGTATVKGQTVDPTIGKIYNLSKEESKNFAELVGTISAEKIVQGQSLVIDQGQEGAYGFSKEYLDKLAETPVQIRIDMDGNGIAETVVEAYKRNGQELVIVPVGENTK